MIRSISISGTWLLVKNFTLIFNFFIMKKDLLHRSTKRDQVSLRVFRMNNHKTE